MFTNDLAIYSVREHLSRESVVDDRVRTLVFKRPAINNSCRKIFQGALEEIILKNRKNTLSFSPVSRALSQNCRVGVWKFVRVKTFPIPFIHQLGPDTHFSVTTFSKNPTVRCKFDSPQCRSPDATHGLIQRYLTKFPGILTQTEP